MESDSRVDVAVNVIQCESNDLSISQACSPMVLMIDDVLTSQLETSLGLDVLGVDKYQHLCRTSIYSLAPQEL